MSDYVSPTAAAVVAIVTPYSLFCIERSRQGAKRVDVLMDKNPPFFQAKINKAPSRKFNHHLRLEPTGEWNLTHRGRSASAAVHL